MLGMGKLRQRLDEGRQNSQVAVTSSSVSQPRGVTRAPRQCVSALGRTERQEPVGSQHDRRWGCWLPISGRSPGVHLLQYFTVPLRGVQMLHVNQKVRQ